MTHAPDWSELGVWPLQDHDDRAKREVRQQLVGMRIKALDEDGVDAGIVQYASEGGMGTLGDLHPWRFWQTGNRENRYAGSWSYAFPVIVGSVDKIKGDITPGGGPRPGGSVPPNIRAPVITGGRGTEGAAEPSAGGPTNPKGYPIKNDVYSSDSRYANVEHNWLPCFPNMPKGTLMIGMAATDEHHQRNLLLHADPRLVAVNIEGSAEAGTIVCDLQPEDEYCMGGVGARAGIDGRTARLQSMMRVIPLEQGGGNGIAWQLGASGQDDLWGYGLTFGMADTSGPTTPGAGGGPDDSNGDRPPVITDPSSGGPGGDNSMGGLAPGAADDMGVRAVGDSGSLESGPGATGTSRDYLRDSVRADLGGMAHLVPGQEGRGNGGSDKKDDFNPETGRFKPKRTRNHAIGMAARRDMFGPLEIGHVMADKHRIGSSKDGDAINSLHLSTDANFYMDLEYDGPLHFEPSKYPNPGPLPGISRVHLVWDGKEPQASGASGKWKWFAEVPFLSPGRPPGGGGPPTGGPPPPTHGPVTPNDDWPMPGNNYYGGPAPGGDGVPQSPGGNKNSGGSEGKSNNAGGAGGGHQGGHHGGSGTEEETLAEVKRNTGLEWIPDEFWEFHPKYGWRPKRKSRFGRYIDMVLRTRNMKWIPSHLRRIKAPSWVRNYGMKQDANGRWVHKGKSKSGPNAAGANPAGGGGKQGEPQPPGIGSVDDWADELRKLREEINRLREHSRRQYEELRREMEERRGKWDQPQVPLDLDKRDNLPGHKIPWNFADPRAQWSTFDSDIDPALAYSPKMVGDANADLKRNLFLIHHPMMEAFTSLAFRPQLDVVGYPDFRHNPDYSLLAARDEVYRPQVVTLHTFGAMKDSEWDYTLAPGSSGRVRGGLAQGGVVYTPPNVTLKEIYDGENGTSGGSGGSVVCSGVGFAPGVTAFFGRPDRDGCLKAKSVTIKQDTGTNEGLKIGQFDSTRTERTLLAVTLDQASGERMTVVGGNQAIQIPRGSSAQRPSAFAPTGGHIRVSTDAKPGGDHVEYYDAAHGVWRQLDHSGGGGGGSAVPAGSILPYGGSTAPTGYLLCDGASYTTAAEPGLFAVIGYTYGGAGANFNVPDLRLKFPQGSDYAGNPPGGTGGSQTPTITDPGHTHTVGATAAMPGPNPVASTAATGSSTTGATIADGRPPFLTLGFIIKG